MTVGHNIFVAAAARAACIGLTCDCTRSGKPNRPRLLRLLLHLSENVFPGGSCHDKQAAVLHVE